MNRTEDAVRRSVTAHHGKVSNERARRGGRHGHADGDQKERGNEPTQAARHRDEEHGSAAECESHGNQPATAGSIRHHSKQRPGRQRRRHLQGEQPAELCRRHAEGFVREQREERVQRSVQRELRRRGAGQQNQRLARDIGNPCAEPPEHGAGIQSRGPAARDAGGQSAVSPDRPFPRPGTRIEPARGQQISGGNRPKRLPIPCAVEYVLSHVARLLRPERRRRAWRTQPVRKSP